ncbi:MAG: hypothetical protein K2X77_10320 [Candidatus Obscuribacterales bacterium]|jgi:hypothetical protein|nr:hypothetical protein [Candidatus Obscuribacterales bacterium]
MLQIFSTRAKRKRPYANCVLLGLGLALFLSLSTVNGALAQGLIGAPSAHSWESTEPADSSEWIPGLAFTVVLSGLALGSVFMKKQRILQGAYLAFLLLLAIPKISHAYSRELNRLDFSAPTVGTETTLSRKSQFSEVTRTESFFTSLLNFTHHRPEMLLWSTYPASVRGRAFGGNGGAPESLAPFAEQRPEGIVGW